MNKLMCRFVATTKKKKEIPDPNLDTACPAGIPCNKRITNTLITGSFHFMLVIASRKKDGWKKKSLAKARGYGEVRVPRGRSYRGSVTIINTIKCV